MYKCLVSSQSAFLLVAILMDLLERRNGSKPSADSVAVSMDVSDDPIEPSADAQEQSPATETAESSGVQDSDQNAAEQPAQPAAPEAEASAEVATDTAAESAEVAVPETSEAPGPSENNGAEADSVADDSNGSVSAETVANPQEQPAE
jgi:hypothetical protein